MKTLKTVQNFIALIMSYLSLIFFIGIIICVTLQIISRLPHMPSLTWTSELTIFLFMGMVATGATLAAKDDCFVKVDLLTTKMSKNGALILGITMNILITIFFIFIIPSCYKFVMLGLNQKTPMLQLSSSIPKNSLLLISIGVGFMEFCNVVYKIEKLISNKNLKGGEVA